MSRKKKPKKGKEDKKPEKENKNRKNIIIAVSVIVAVIALVAVGMQLRSTSDRTTDSVSAVDDTSMRKGETRPTLSPAQFSDPFIARMYQAARDIPHVFDSLKCYCFCERDPFYHVSLLSCFTDKHAAG